MKMTVVVGVNMQCRKPHLLHNYLPYWVLNKIKQERLQTCKTAKNAVWSLDP